MVKVAFAGRSGSRYRPAIVGDDDLAELRRRVRGFRDHPDAGLGPARARDHAGDVVGVDRDRRGGATSRGLLPGCSPDGPAAQNACCDDQKQLPASIARSSLSHEPARPSGSHTHIAESCCRCRLARKS